MDLRARTILLAVGGSRAYGIHRPDSDTDVKGVAIPPAVYFHGVWSRFEQSGDVAVFADLVGPCEGVVFDIRKFLALAAECNPNILDVLFCRDEEVRLVTPLGRRLRDARELFVTARARFTFGEYAAAQLKRIKGHRRWLLDPPKGPPDRAACGPAEYLAARRAWRQYEEWRTKRNPARAALEARAGFDTKHAAHLVRLLRMGREILETGRVNVWREDAEELKAIRDGAWPYERVVEVAEAGERALAELWESGRHVVPATPDRDAIERLGVELVEEAIGYRGSQCNGGGRQTP
ncbi:MAG: DNA polymerase beta superfamily protein [Myxococcota bacterium]